MSDPNGPERAPAPPLVYACFHYHQTEGVTRESLVKIVASEESAKAWVKAEREAGLDADYDEHEVEP